MFTAVIAALLLLAAGVAAAYLILKNMSEEGIEIAAPGSCRRGRCGPQCKPPAEPVDETLLTTEEAPLPIADAENRSEAKA